MSDSLEWIRSHCARMDHGGCALLLGVKDGRLVSVKSDPQGYLNRGYRCVKAATLPQRHNHPDRLHYPLLREGRRGEGKWRRISWQEAIEKIRGNLEGIKNTYGARSVAFCQGMPKGLDHFVLIRLANLFGSPNVVAFQDVCHAPREISGRMTCGFYPVADYHHSSSLILLWGSNPPSTNEEGQICRLVFQQLQQGTQLIVVDPRRTEMARRAKYWLQIRPGTDAALALAFLNVIVQEGLYDRRFVQQWTHGFSSLAQHVQSYSPERMAEVTWVDPELIRQSARLYASSRPASIGWGNPLEHTVQSFDALRALVCLMSICGNLDVPGGNVQANEPDVMSLRDFVRAPLLPNKKKEMIHAYHGTIRGLMTVPPVYFRRAVLQDYPYPVRAAYIQCSNPIMTQADSSLSFEALNKLDFLAVSEIFMTPTAALADVVLPAATYPEFDDIGHYGLGHGFILARPGAVDPPGQCRPDLEILNELGKALTPQEHWHVDYRGFLDELLGPSGLSFKEFAQKGVLKGEENFRKYASQGFATPTGKVELELSKAKDWGLSPWPGWSEHIEKQDVNYPLVLTSAKSRFYLHSSYRWLNKLRKLRPEPLVRIHPRTAAEYGLSHSRQAIIETPQGSMVQNVHLTEDVSPGVVIAQYGWWFPEDDQQSLYGWQKANYNLLTTVSKVGREFATPNLKGIKCRIGPVESKAEK